MGMYFHFLLKKLSTKGLHFDLGLNAEFSTHTKKLLSNLLPPQPNPPWKVLLYTKFPIGVEPFTIEPDIESGSLAKNGWKREK